MRGRFPLEGSDQLISLAWLEESRQQGPQEDDGTSEVWVGIDVAGPGEDETVAYVRQDGRVIAWKAWAGSDPRGEVKQFLTPYLGRLRRINVDSVGIGYYFYIDLRDWVQGKGIANPGGAFTVAPVNVGEAARNGEQFFNRKAEHYWGLRDRLLKDRIPGLTDQRAIAQLASLKYKSTPRGQVQIESKEDARKRGIKSPDRAEAIMLCFADEGEPAIVEFYRRRIEAERQRGERPVR